TVQPPKRPSAQKPRYLDPSVGQQLSGPISRDAIISGKPDTDTPGATRLPAIPEEVHPDEIKTVPLEFIQKNRGLWTVFRRLTRRT
ncbi:MAG TPA: hypothetical protein VGN34_02005, partial [Ktedonobacteraceae bacterium]